MVPLFADQSFNAERVAAVGAGVAVAPDAREIRAGVYQVLEKDTYRAATEGLAGEMRSHPATGSVVEALIASAQGSALT